MTDKKDKEKTTAVNAKKEDKAKQVLSQLQGEASNIALQLYNVNLERKRLENRMKELSVAINSINAVVPDETKS